jgi:hypothetical protein
MNRKSVSRQSHGRIMVIAVVLVIWGLITHGTHAGSGDEPHYMLIAHSLAFDRDLDLANNYRTASLITANTLEPERHARMVDGRLRPVHDIGMPLLFAPAVGMAYMLAERLGERIPPRWLQRARLNEGLLFRHQMSLLMALLTGLLGRELFLLFRDLSGQPRHALLWALLFTLSPPILSHSFLFFTEIPTALIALAVFRRLTTRPMDSVARGGVLGILAGLLVLVHTRNVGLLGGLLAIAAVGAWRRQISWPAFGALLAGAATAVALRTAVTFMLWGSLVATPHAAFAADVSVVGTTQQVFVRFTGLLLDREHGLLTYAPIYVLAFAGLVFSARKASWLRVAVGLVGLAYLLPILLPQVNVHGWRGGWSPAARFIVPIAPLLCVAAYQYALAAPRWALAPVVLLQLLLNAYVWQFPKTLWNDGDGVASLRFANWLPSWTAGESATWNFGVALLALAAAAIWLGKFSRPTDSRASAPSG